MVGRAREEGPPKDYLYFCALLEAGHYAKFKRALFSLSCLILFVSIQHIMSSLGLCHVLVW